MGIYDDEESRIILRDKNTALAVLRAENARLAAERDAERQAKEAAEQLYLLEIDELRALRDKDSFVAGLYEKVLAMKAELAAARAQVARLRASLSALLDWLNPNTDPLPPDKRGEVWATAELAMRNTQAAADAFVAEVRAAERERITNDDAIDGTRVTLSRVIAELADDRKLSEFCADYDLDLETVTLAVQRVAAAIRRETT